MTARNPGERTDVHGESRKPTQDDSMFRSLVEQSRDILYECDRQGVFTYCSPSVEQHFGYTPNELIGTSVREYVHPEQIPQFEERLSRALAGEQLRLKEIRMRRKDGSYMPVEVNTGPHYVDGRIVGFLGAARDVSERKEAEAALRESEHRFRVLVEHMPVGVVQTTVEGEFVYMNEYAMKTVGFRSAEQASAEGGVPSRYKYQKDREITLGLLRKNGRFDNYPLELLTKSDETIHVLVSAKITDGVITGILLNITDLKRAQEKVVESQRQLRTLAGHLQTIREEERKRIAREIHDELGQSMTALNIDLTWLGTQVAGIDRALLAKVNRMTTLVEGSIKTVKRISAELRPGVLDDLGLTAAIEWHAGEFE
jgi:PAS domain S-box-containing protein